jgi:hypothetical protein
MMKIRVHNVVIHKDKVCKPSKQVWPWELPVLEEQYPAGLVAVDEDSYVERDSLPDPEGEFSRLGIVFGNEPETGQALVHLAYGRGKAGIKALAEVIEGSLYDDKPKAAKRPPAKKKAAAKKKATAKKEKESTQVPADPFA